MKHNIIVLILIFTSIQLLGQGESLIVPQYKPYGLPLGDRITSYDLIDINNDDEPDAVASIILDGVSSILVKFGPNLDELITQPDFNFQFESPNPSRSIPLYVAWSDIDMDSDYDIYLGEHAEFDISAAVRILENKSSGMLNFELNTNFAFDIEQLTAVPSPVDYDNDGLEDLFVSDFTGQIKVYKNNGSFSFTKIDISEWGLDQYEFQCAIDELPNSQNLLAFDGSNGFTLLIYKNGTYILDTSSVIINDPDFLVADFYQPRLRDYNNDGLTDAFLSSNTFSANNGYYSDTWLYNGICQDTLRKNEIPVISASYSARNLITSAGEIDGLPGVIYKAGNAIELEPNFTVGNNALFQAIIQNCGNE